MMSFNRMIPEIFNLLKAVSKKADAILSGLNALKKPVQKKKINPYAPSRVSPALSTEITNIDDSWSKEVPFGSKKEDYPWTINGEGDENALIMSADYPHTNGERCPVWKCNSIAGKADGGYVSPLIPIDNKKIYRFSTYIMKRKKKDGTTYHGTNGYVNGKNAGLLRRTTLTVNKNVYFWRGDLPTVDEWYLVVGFIFPVGSPKSTLKRGGIYKMGSTEKLVSAADFVFTKETEAIRVRDYLYYTKSNNTKQDMFAPDLQIADGSEKPLRLLLGVK